MRAGNAAPAFYANAQRWQERPPSHSAPKRKFSSLAPPLGQSKQGYPSPPMSSPPSPPSTVPEPIRTTLSQSRSITAAGSSNINPPAATAPNQPHAFQPPALVPPARSTEPQSHLPYFPSLPSLGAAPLVSSAPSPLSSFGVLQPVTNGTLGAAAFATSSGLSSDPTSRSGRKPKAHVASACVNCKRAHLSCDVQRPCARCVTSGKQDSCYDVQHKKRGRPRLREDGEFKIEELVPEQPSESTISQSSAETSSRPIATPRQRRPDSLRSLRSQTSESSSIHTPSLRQSSSLQSPFNYSRPPSGFSLAPAEVPTAFLDLDLVFLRANQPFQQILSGGQDVKGRQLGEMAAPADTESFEAIRNRLRAERQAREPNYMPPIAQSGQDPTQGVSEGDIDRLSSTFSESTYTWTRSHAGSNAESFPARVRLAKTTAYFIVVTLPSFRPTPALASSPVAASPFAMSPLSSRGMQSAPPPLPGGYQAPLAASSLPSSRRTSLGPYSYPSSQLGTPYQQALAPSTPQLRPPDFPIEQAPAPRGTTREAMPPPPIGSQLLPLSDQSSMAPATARSERGEAQPQRASSEEEGDEGSPKKRRRLGIEEVIQ